MLTNEFSYNDTLSSTFGIFCEMESHSILPAMRQYTQEIPGYDGVIDYQIGGYGTRIISVPLFYTGNFKDLRLNREKIIAWLAGDGKPKKLIFGNEPNKYYLAKIYSEINLSNSSDRKIGTIEFECNPPWQYSNGILLTPDNIIWTNCQVDRNQFIKEFTSNGSIKFVNTGTLSVKPIIKLIGNIKNGVTLSNGTQTFKYNADCVLDGIVIDCNNETVVKMSDNSNLYSNVDSTNNDFFEFQSGNCEIELTMTGIWDNNESVTIIIEFVPRNGG